MNGSHARPWVLSRGALPGPKGFSSFEVWAPLVRTVAVRLARSGEEFPLAARGGGVFGGTAPARAEDDYYYRLDGERDRPDPVSRFQPEGVHGPSRIVDPGAFPWKDGGWSGLAMADLVLYELHVGTFTSAGTFDAIVPRLPELVDLGVTAIELMPVAEFPGARNWGYDGVHPYAVQSTYGGPDGMRRLIDAAHRAGIGVVLDVVYNHLGPEGNYLPDYGPYFTDRYQTPWGRAINFDDADSDEVRRYFVDNALYWATEFHVDGLRLDAVHGIYDFTARHILEEMADAVHRQAELLGRRILVIAESDLNDPRLIRERDRGGYGLDAQWSDDFHHAVHTALTGERAGYYVDFDGAPSVRKALRDRFVIDGVPSHHRRRRHGAGATDVSAERFVVFIQNHDQVGNRARGDRLSSLTSPGGLRLAAAVMLLSPYVPLLFMGEEYGETHPFLYFVSHGDPALVEAVRTGRKREFQSFEWSGDLSDPQAEGTFLASRLDHSRVRTPDGKALRTLYRDLIALRREEPALEPGAATASILDVGVGTFALRLGHPAGDLLTFYNFGNEPSECELPADRAWSRRLSTDDRPYGGRDRLSSITGRSFLLPARTAILFHEGTDDA